MMDAQQHVRSKLTVIVPILQIYQVFVTSVGMGFENLPRDVMMEYKEIF